MIVFWKYIVIWQISWLSLSEECLDLWLQLYIFFDWEETVSLLMMLYYQAQFVDPRQILNFRHFSFCSLSPPFSLFLSLSLSTFLSLFFIVLVLRIMLCSFTGFLKEHWMDLYKKLSTVQSKIIIQFLNSIYFTKQKNLSRCVENFSHKY